LKTVDAQIDEASLKKVFDSLNAKPLNELIANGLKKVGSAPAPAAKGGKAPEAKKE
jgi:ribosomal protein L12E/L44/L45/RPP1/RPP2